MLVTLAAEADARFFCPNRIVLDEHEVILVASELRGTRISAYQGAYVCSSKSQVVVSSDLVKRTMRARVASGLEGLVRRADGWLAGAPGGLFRSTDAGKTWKHTRVPPLPAQEQIVSLVEHDGSLWVAGARGSLLRAPAGTFADGAWEPVPRPGARDRGKVSYGTSSSYPETSLSRLEVADGTLYALGLGGIWRLSDDGGAQLELATEHEQVVDMDVTAAGTIIAAGTRGLLVRRPAGSSAWEPIASSSSGAHVGVVALESGVLVVKTHGDDAVRWSPDDGRTFTALPTADGRPLGALATEDTRLHVAAADGRGGALIAGYGALLLRASKDGLGPWAAASPRKSAGKRATKAERDAAPRARAHAAPMAPCARDAEKEAALLAAVAANPNDDTPRLVYADWLLEHDDPRGEFIQLQCRLGTARNASGLARRVSAPTFPTVEHQVDDRLELERRELSLLKKHGKAWVAPIRPHIYQFYWRRGFTDIVEAKGAVFLDGADAVFDAMPVVHATLTSFDRSSLPKLTTTAALRRLRSLSLREQRIEAKDAHVLASTHFSALEHLDLYANPLGDDGVARFAKEAELPRLVSLDLSSTLLGVRGIEALADADFFPRLQSLDVANHRSDAEAAARVGPRIGELLARGRSLVHVRLTGQLLGDEGARAVAAANLPDLGSLVIDGVTGEGLLALARASRLASLAVVHFHVPGGESGPHADSVRAALPELRARFGEGFARGWKT